MSPVELELTATIAYEGGKAGIKTVGEADPILRRDLTEIGLPHPKKTNVSVVCPGVVRFYWIALSNSTIHHNLLDKIRPKHNLEAHHDMLSQLYIQSFTLQESPAPSLRKADFAAKEWNAGLPNRPDFDAFYPTPDSRSISSLGRNPSGESSTKPPRFAQGPVKIKTEPVADTMPLNHHQDSDRMQIDTHEPRKQYLNRNRYKSIPDFTNPSETEIQALRRELREIRRQLNADILEERGIVESLRELGAEVESDVSEIDFVTKARIELFEAELQEERARRRKLEEIVEDIRRERKAPFVVPALLDAFLDISKLTNQVLEEG
ncbi:hypothetical protein C8R45DRAFT_1001744 [Mycena sanguinolenta]|nr:hypothetical protein C8R45DRAFT_1001744 [Mycena sanguinolenta]